jgi:hypothetical protein
MDRLYPGRSAHRGTNPAIGQSDGPDLDGGRTRGEKDCDQDDPWVHDGCLKDGARSMTIRILEDGDYRLQESGCIRDLQQSARVLENGDLRSYENGSVKQIQDAQMSTKKLENCCGSRRLENNSRRILEVGCVGVISVVEASYSLTNKTIECFVAIKCIKVDILPCAIYFRWSVSKIVLNELTLIVSSDCIGGGLLSCDTSDNWQSTIDQVLVDGNYIAACFLYNDVNCSNMISTQSAYFDVSTA